MTEFAQISSIDCNNQTTWAEKIFLTLDIDWAHDEVINDTLDIIEKHKVAATFFVTHATPVLERLRDNPDFELGIHPNFNYLLNGDTRNGRNAEEVIDRLLELVPEAVSVRSHSMTQSSVLLDLFSKKGLTHDVNHFVPSQTNIQLKPWALWHGMCRVPYFWEDDIACIYNTQSDFYQLTSGTGLKVFDFHPIHIFLNTEQLERYENTRHLHQKPDELISHRCALSGSRTNLINLLQSI